MALPAPRSRPGWMDRFDSPWWALVPALSIAAVIGAIELSSDSAEWLSWLALVAVPPLAALALADLTRIRLNRRISGVETDSRSGLGWTGAFWVAVTLFALAWASPDSLAGEASATALSGLACIALGWLLVCVVQGRWLVLGVYAMATVDACFVAADLLQGPNAVLSAAAPAADLPRLQVVHFGSALMGFGDLFVAGLVGCLLARDRSRQLEAALLVAALALAFDLLFFAVDTLPATVPVAVALALIERGRHRMS